MPPRPIMIAVGGDSGTGKRSLCRGLEAIFGAGRIETLDLDDYHSLDRLQRKLVGYTATDPRASNFAAMEEDLWALREGRVIEKPIYDHTDGTFKGTERMEPHEIIIVRGLFPLSPPPSFPSHPFSGPPTFQDFYDAILGDSNLAVRYSRVFGERDWGWLPVRTGRRAGRWREDGTLGVSGRLVS